MVKNLKLLREGKASLEAAAIQLVIDTKFNINDGATRRRVEARIGNKNVVVIAVGMVLANSNTEYYWYQDRDDGPTPRGGDVPYSKTFCMQFVVKTTLCEWDRFSKDTTEICYLTAHIWDHLEDCLFSNPYAALPYCDMRGRRRLKPTLRTIDDISWGRFGIDADEFAPAAAHDYSRSTTVGECFFCLCKNTKSHQCGKRHRLNREKTIGEFAALWKIDTDSTRHIMSYLYDV
jgi:hypothetical protein